MKTIPLTLFIVGFLTLLVSLVVSIYTHQEKMIITTLSKEMSTLEFDYKNELAHVAENLEGLLDFIQRDEGIQQAWIMRNRDILIQETVPIYKMINKRFEITHFYFHEKEGVNFLRVHKPVRFENKTESAVLRPG